MHLIATDIRRGAGGLEEAVEHFVIPVTDVDRVARTAREVRAQGIIATTNHAVATAAQVAEQLNLPGIHLESARIATSKSAMRKCWDEAGVPAPRMLVVNTNAEVEPAVAQLGYPILVEPAHTTGDRSRGASIARHRSELAAALQYALRYAADGALILEKYVAPVSYHSVELLFECGNAHVIAVGDTSKTPLPYCVDMDLQYPTALDLASTRLLTKAAIDAARTIGITHGLVHVELGWTSYGPVVFHAQAHCGYTAIAQSLLSWVTGIDLFTEACRVSCGIRPSLTYRTEQRGGCFRLLAPRVGTTLDSEPLSVVKAMPGVIDVHWWAKPGAPAPTVRSVADHSGAVATGAETREEALKIAQAAAELFGCS